FVAPLRRLWPRTPRCVSAYLSVRTSLLCAFLSSGQCSAYSRSRRFAMSINLPKPIAAYFAAAKAGDAGALARCFASNGVVHDEGGSFTGRAAIEKWNATARAKYHHIVVPLGATERDGALVVIGRVSGQFPGSPVELQHVFRLD